MRQLDADDVLAAVARDVFDRRRAGELDALGVQMNSGAV
jgi:hypothetical protein